MRRYEPYLRRVDAFLEQCPRFEDGAFHRPGKGMMTDDPYMTVPYLVRRWKASGNAADLDSAIAQITGTHRRLFDAETKLFRHLWDLKTQKPAGVFWGRGNGWMVLAQVELLEWLPEDHPRRKECAGGFYRSHDRHPRLPGRVRRLASGARSSGVMDRDVLHRHVRLWPRPRRE